MSIWSAEPYGGGGELTGPCFSHSLGGFFGSGFGFSSAVMVFSLLSLMQRAGPAADLPEMGKPRVLHGLTCWGSPRANTGALLGEEKQPSRSACSEGTCFELPPITPSLGTSWDGDPRGHTAPPSPALPSGIPKSPFLGHLASGTKTKLLFQALGLNLSARRSRA